MTDIFEIQITENPLELIFSEEQLEIVISEDNLEILVQSPDQEIVLQNEGIEVLTVAEQGPPGILGAHVGTTPPQNPQVGALWIDTN